MSASSTPPGRLASPGDPLQIVVTQAGQAWVGERSVPVPAGADPRVAAAEFVSALALRDGREISAVLVDAGRGERRRMMFSADGQVLQSTRPMPDVGYGAATRTDEPAAHTGEAAARTEGSTGRAPDVAVQASAAPHEAHDFADRPGQDASRGHLPAQPPSEGPGRADVTAHPADGSRIPQSGRGDDLGLAMMPGPPLDVDPDSVPAWPHFDITLLSEVHVVVNGVRHDIPPAAHDPRAFAVAMAAAQLRRTGLARPVRATARDPDGTAWPILIHPGGAATEAGLPETPGDKGRRGRRADRRGYR